MERRDAENFLRSALGIGGAPVQPAAAHGTPAQHAPQSAESTSRQPGRVAHPAQPAQNGQPPRSPPLGSPRAAEPAAPSLAQLAHALSQLGQLQTQIANEHRALQHAAILPHNAPGTSAHAQLEALAVDLVQRHGAIAQQIALHQQAYHAALQQQQQAPPQPQPHTQFPAQPAHQQSPQTRAQPQTQPQRTLQTPPPPPPPPHQQPPPRTPQSARAATSAPHEGKAPLYARAAQPPPAATPPPPPPPSSVRALPASPAAWAKQPSPSAQNRHAHAPPPTPPQPTPTGPAAAPFAEEPPPADAHFDARLSFEIRSLHAAKAPPADDERWRRAVVKQVGELSARLWHGARVVLFGSSASGLHTAGADLDLCLIPPKQPHNNAARRMISSLGAELEAHGMEEVLPLPSARVPIVKFVDRASKLKCDICVNNQLALANTGLVGAYARLDARVRPLVAVVKHWAAARKVNEPYLGTLSSYAYVLLTVNYLQTTMPPVLPCLQTLGRPAGAERIVDGYDAWWQDDPRALAAAGFEVGANASSVGELLVGFFRRYATEFNVERHVACVRLGRLLPKADKVWGQSQTVAARKGRKADRHLFCIEDPFEVTHDLGRVMDATSMSWVQQEFARAHALLSQGAPLGELCRAWSNAEEEQEARADGADAAGAAGGAHRTPARDERPASAADDDDDDRAIRQLAAELESAALGGGGEDFDQSAVQLPAGLF